MPDARGSQSGERPRRNGEAGSKPRRPPWAISGVILIRLVTSHAFLIALVVWSFMWVTVGASWAGPLFIVAVIALAIRRGSTSDAGNVPGPNPHAVRLAAALGLDAYAATATSMTTGTQTNSTQKTGTRTTNGARSRTIGTAAGSTTRSADGHGAGAARTHGHPTPGMTTTTSDL